MREFVANTNEVTHIAHPDEVAAVIGWLCTDAASRERHPRPNGLTARDIGQGVNVSSELDAPQRVHPVQPGVQF